MPTKVEKLTGFNQGEWWQTKDGLIHLIADLEVRHRVNIAAWLINRAASYHLQLRRQWYNWDLWVGGYGGDAADDAMDDYFRALEENPNYVEDLIRKEQDRGEHLDWMRGTKLFKAICAGIENQLPPGVLGKCEHGFDCPHDYDSGSYYAPEISYCPGP